MTLIAKVNNSFQHYKKRKLPLKSPSYLSFSKIP